MALLGATCLARATAPEVTVRREGASIDCGATLVVALKGSAPRRGTPDLQAVEERCQRIAIQRFVGWSLGGWALLGISFLALGSARESRPSAAPDVRLQ